MDSKRIEAFAVMAVEERILNAGNFNPVFNKNDTLPSWDGEILVYKGEVQSKNELIEVIPVQIKGTIQDKRRDGKFNYSVEVADLKNYLSCKSGSVLYFVVYIKKVNEGIQKAIYYNKLLPYDLKRILSLCDNQNTVTLAFDPFPEKKEEIACLLHDVARDIKKQRACINAREITLEDLKSEQGIPILTISRTVPNTKSLQNPATMLGFDGYFYTERQDNLFQPVIHGRIDGISQNVPVPILIKSDIYYTSYQTVDYLDRKEFVLSEGVRFILSKEKCVFNLQYSQKGRISEQLNDAQFLLKLSKHKEFSIGTHTIPFDLKDAISNTINFALLNDIINLLSLFKKFIEVLDVRDEPNIEDVNENDIQNLTRLTGFIADGNLAKTDYKTQFVVNNYEIAGLNVLVFAEYVEGTEGGYRMKNFNDVSNIVTMKVEDGTRYQTSIYAILTEEDFLKVSNINFKKMLNNLQTIPMSEGHSQVLTRLVAHMLLAYDKSGDKRTDILNTAIKLAEWQEKNDTQTSQTYLRLNKYEAIKRSRALNNDEENDLLEIAEDAEQHLMLRATAHLLLGQIKSADYCFSQLSPDEKQIFITYPVWRFKN